MAVYESDVCIIGAGISAAMLAEKLCELRPGASIVVVEAGRSIFDVENRFTYRDQLMQYGKNPWPEDFIPDQAAEGQISRTMAVGGQALHWGAACNRFSEEDLRLKSLYGLYEDWPIEWADLERHYCEAERRMGVSGGPSLYPEDQQSQPYPMPAMPLSYDLAQLKEWGDKSGALFQGIPQAKNTIPYDDRSVCLRCGTCDICPTGAKYSPDFTFKRLLQRKKITLHDRTLVRRLVLAEKGDKIASAQAVHRDHPNDPVEYRAGLFVLAGGYTWAPSSSALDFVAIPEWRRESKWSGWQVFHWTCIHLRNNPDRSRSYSRNESHVWVDLAKILSLRSGPDLYAPRSTHLVQQWPTAQAEDRFGRDAFGRRCADRLASA
jgi:choline dehydrogenase-like flavoprotein